MWNQFKVATRMLLVMTVLTGLVYPLAITGIAQIVFHRTADGCLIERDGQAVGSELIGQPFDDPKYFWGRPSATTPIPYNAASSAGSNLAVTNPGQFEAIAERVKKLRDADPGNTAPVPIDLVTASGSGLDADISVAAAVFQVSRIARVRHMSADVVRQLVEENAQGRQLGILGEPRVNVLRLNLALDGASIESETKQD